MSRIRAPTNLQRTDDVYVGRNKSLYSALNSLKTNKCLNILGICGIGKTRFLHELGYFSYMRNYYNGVYLIDMKDVTSMRKFIEKV
jgi:ABC-type lipoprotein export system ATPase subunit